MPCRDDGWEGVIAQKEELDKLTDMLCRMCRGTESAGRLSVLPPDVQVWWAEHKKADAAREAQERAEKAQLDLKKKALKKLSAEEKKALGL